MNILQPIGEALWMAEGPVVDFYRFPYPTRMLVARLTGGGLWVWSPVQLTEQLGAETEALGRVAHLVSPNKLHHLYLAEWHRAFPGAMVWGPASTRPGFGGRSRWTKSSSSTARRAPRSSPI